MPRNPKWKQETPRAQLTVLLQSAWGDVSNVVDNFSTTQRVTLVRAMKTLQEAMLLNQTEMPDSPYKSDMEGKCPDCKKELGSNPASCHECAMKAIVALEGNPYRDPSPPSCKISEHQKYSGFTCIWCQGGHLGINCPKKIKVST